MSAGNTLLWAGLCLAGVAMLAPNLSTGADPQKVEAPASSGALPAPQPAIAAPIGNGFASEELVRSADGHFYAEAQVNGAPVRFLVDTGATMVVLTPEDAQRAGIALGSDRTLAMAAGGTVEMIPVTIDRIAVGSLAASQLPAAVVEELPVSLLGQAFLARIGKVEISEDRMVLR